MIQFILRQKLVITAIIMLLITLFFFSLNPSKKIEEPTYTAPMSPYSASIAGSGTIEPASEAIEIGTNIAGIVTTVYVQPGQLIKIGDPLFTIDDRDAKAQYQLAKAAVTSAKVQLADSKHELALYESISDKRAISKDTLNKKRYAAQLANSRVTEAEAQERVIATLIERSTVRSPINGTVLKVNIHEGEYAVDGQQSSPLLIIGDIKTLHVRVEVDEIDATHFSAHNKAVGYLLGYAKMPIPLKFIRIEPIAIPKKSITNAGNEIVDTRTIDIIFAIENKKDSPPLYSGQRLDVFIESGTERS